MSASGFVNLDLACAKKAQALAKEPSKELYTRITAALAVLEEQGVYALFLFLRSQNETSIDPKLLELLNDIFPNDLPSNASSFDFLKWLAEDLDRLLLAQALLRQTLVYARYHAKPSKNEDEKKS